MAQEAYAIMKDLAHKKRDEFDVYGESVAISLRKLRNVAATYAKFEINKILFNAELGYYDFPPTHSTAFVSSKVPSTNQMLSPQKQHTTESTLMSQSSTQGPYTLNFSEHIAPTESTGQVLSPVEPRTQEFTQETHTSPLQVENPDQSPKLFCDLR